MPPTSVRGLLVVFSLATYGSLTLISKAGAVAGQTGEPEERAVSNGLAKISPAWLTASRLWKTFSIQILLYGSLEPECQKTFARIGHTLIKLMHHAHHVDTKFWGNFPRRPTFFRLALGVPYMESRKVSRHGHCMGCDLDYSLRIEEHTFTFITYHVSRRQ